MGLKRFSTVLSIFVSVLSVLTLCEGNGNSHHVNPVAKNINSEVVPNLKSASDVTKGTQEKQTASRTLTNTAVFIQASAKCELLPTLDLPSSYFLCPPSLNWFMANNYCQKLGMSLPVINSKPVYDNLVRNLKYVVGLYSGNLPGFWIGGTDLGSEGTFYWYPNGEPLTFTQLWKAGEPNNYGGNENCMNLVNYATTDPLYHSEFPFYSNDANCYVNTMGVICQLDDDLKCL